MLAAHSDQNNSYEITMNGYQARNINEIGKNFWPPAVVSLPQN